ncbi:hypothetical protein DCCM_4263 [Desulfocucumis palustris]|uniref:Uncharacterized protein n=1 Tax=Desulfocucumis palustris TaxID=1898651 RepID=A0A2L2XG73_9FIRM|nr:hypothetical protein DCCM_4263 [Desulfocucumis palustris]
MWAKRNKTLYRFSKPPVNPAAIFFMKPCLLPAFKEGAFSGWKGNIICYIFSIC